MERTFGSKPAYTLSQAMRSYGAMGTPSNQRITFAGGLTLAITRSRTTAGINEAFVDASDERTALAYSNPRTNDVRVVMSIEAYASMIGLIDRLSLEAGRVEE